MEERCLVGRWKGSALGGGLADSWVVPKVNSGEGVGVLARCLFDWREAGRLESEGN